MRVCYIISTCDKYLDNRVKYQMETVFKNVNKEDIYYLTSKADVENRRFGWDAPDNLESLPLKYIHFFKNMNIENNYDWFVLFDDDTFVFIDRLQKMLSTYNPDDNVYIGKELDHIKRDWCLYMSGGAGYVVSKNLYSLMVNHVRKDPDKALLHWCDDLCIGLWIVEFSKTHKILHINNDNFHVNIHNNKSELETAITFHKVIQKEQFDFYDNYIQNNIQSNNTYSDTVFVLVTDQKYFNKAERTIIDLRTRGKWNGKIFVITLDFILNADFKNKHNINEVKFTPINKKMLLDKIGNGFSNSDKRELYKLNQWEKIHVFDNFFTQWKRVVFLDAGLRVLDSVDNLLNLDYKNAILAPNDCAPYFNPEKIFKQQLSFDNPQYIESLTREFGENIFNSQYMLNCIWIYDTNILKICDKKQLVQAMNDYPVCKTNEMTVMNLLFHFKYKLWREFPIKAENGKYLFEWCETNHPFPTAWSDYCFIKYPVTIDFNS
jgi:hypothetical protein